MKFYLCKATESSVTIAFYPVSFSMFLNSCNIKFMLIEIFTLLSQLAQPVHKPRLSSSPLGDK